MQQQPAAEAKELCFERPAPHLAGQLLVALIMYGIEGVTADVGRRAPGPC
jgi:hypothetical protein